MTAEFAFSGTFLFLKSQNLVILSLSLDTVAKDLEITKQYLTKNMLHKFDTGRSSPIGHVNPI